MTEQIEKEKLARATFGMMSVPGSTSQAIWSSDDVDKLEAFGYKEYKKVVDQCRFFYRKDPIASTVINKLIEIGVSEIVMDKADLSENEFRAFLAVKDSLQDFMEVCALEYLISGLVIPEIKYAAVSKDKLNENGIKKYSSLVLPVYMWLRDPTSVKINDTMVMDKPSYYVMIPEELVYFIQHNGEYPDGNKDLDLYEELKKYYPEFVVQVKNGNKEILLDNDYIVRRKPSCGSAYPTPYLEASLEALKHKRNLRRMDYAVSARVISAIQLFNLGSDEFPVTEDDADRFNYVRDQMTWRNTAGRNVERIFQLFADHTLKIAWVTPPVDVLLNDKKYVEVNQDIFFGLGFPRILTTGETERSSASDPEYATMSPEKTMENIQRRLKFIAEGILKNIADLNSFKSYPRVRFKPINLHSFKNFVDGMNVLYETGNVSRTSFSDALGYNWEEEANKLSEEQKIIEKLGINEFAPRPFSNQPGNSQDQAPKDQTPKDQQKPPESNKNTQK